MHPRRHCLLTLAVPLLAGCAVRAQSPAPRHTLTPFRSDSELVAFLRRYAQPSRRGVLVQGGLEDAGVANAAPEMAKDAVAPSAQAASSPLFRSEMGNSITNTQHAGVDEGDIVKLHGDYLVILRRGRLFTVRVGGDALQPTAAVDAFGPDIDPSGTWYDELLIAGDRVVVIGYSYQRGGTEVGLFHLDDAGQLEHRGTYQLRSNDYYSSRNYASRLVGTTLVFYAPLYLPWGMRDPLAALPALRRWRSDLQGGAFERIASPQRVYHPVRDWTPSAGLALHSVTSCDLAAADIRCEATVVAGPPGRVFYVSPHAVYVWTTDVQPWRRFPAAERNQPVTAMVVRMPLDGGAPTALAATGSPVDQFSFLESEDGFLNVMVRSEGAGEAMWGGERSRGEAALLRIPVRSFGDGSDAVPRWRYRPLPAPDGSVFQNRFVGEVLLYGAGNGWGASSEQRSTLHVVPLRGGDAAEVALPHGVDRIEAMGRDAVVVGSNGPDLLFTGIRLDGDPHIAQQFTLPGASQGELRSHGFFYRQDGERNGVFGLPVRDGQSPGYVHLVRGSAAVLYVRNDGTRFESLGTLDASTEERQSDGCRASCVDWYGNARPLFIGGRTFALMGYEVVEGRIRGGAISETRRTSFAPSMFEQVRR